MTAGVVLVVLSVVAAQWRLCAHAGDSAAMDAGRGVCLALAGRDDEARVAARSALRRSATPDVAFLSQRIDALLQAPIAERSALVEPDSVANDIQRAALLRLQGDLGSLDAQCEPAH